MAQSSTMCPLHLSSPAVFTCKRCGTFGCERCQSPTAAGLCVPCGERMSMPVGVAVGDTVREGFDFLKQRPQLLLASAGVYTAFGVVMLPISLPMAKAQAQSQGGNPDLSGLFSKVLISLLVGFLFSTVFEAIVTRYVGEQLGGEDNPPGDTVRAALERLVPAMISNLLVSISVTVGFVLCIVPGVILSMGLCLAIPSAVLGEKGGMESLTDSWELTKEQRGNVFLVLLVSGLAFAGVALASVLIQSILGRMGTPGVVLGILVNQALSGVSICIPLTMLVLCYMKLAGRPIMGS